MRIETKWLGVILIATVALLLGGVFLLTRKGSAPVVAGTSVVQIDYSKGQKIGSDSAKIRLVEFSDFECPACLTAEPYVRKVRGDYVADIQFIYRHFPLPQHKHSRQAAALAEASAKQNKFWEMHDKLFETQKQWTGLGDSEANAFFLSLARQLGLDENRIKQDMADADTQARISADWTEGNNIGVNATPTFFLNGHKLNLQQFEDLDIVISQELKK